MKIGKLEFKKVDTIAILLRTKDIKMTEYVLKHIDGDLIVWLSKKHSIAHIYYDTEIGGVKNSIAKKILPKYIFKIKDDSVFLEKMMKYLSKKVYKELKKEYRIVYIQSI